MSTRNFTRFRGNSPIIFITITEPSERTGYDYYYPDGITFGIFKKKTYFVGFCNEFLRNGHGDTDYFETPEDAIKKMGDINVCFAKNGKIWNYGYVVFRFQDLNSSHTFKFKELSEVNELLENMSAKIGFQSQDFICLEDKSVLSLYEYKESLH